MQSRLDSMDRHLERVERRLDLVEVRKGRLSD
jgi:hypothetical protein